MTKSPGHPSTDIVGTRGAELAGVRVILCVSGSVAAIEAPEIARELMRHGGDVWAVMSTAANKIIHPTSLYWATGHPVVTRLTGGLEHISLLQAERVIVLIAPATANTISKIAHGIDDTPVTTLCSVALGLGVPVLVAPAMHEPMYQNPFVLESIDKLKGRGVVLVPPRIEEGKAKMEEPQRIAQRVIEYASEGPLKGRKVVVTAGPTVEYIDPIRIVTNRSSGLMGFALAERARDLGASVTLIVGPTPLNPPHRMNIAHVTTTAQMKEALEDAVRAGADIVLAAAAPADFKPVEMRRSKLDTRAAPNLALKLVPTPKVIGQVKKLHPRCVLVAFKAETDPNRLAERAAVLMNEVQADIVVANDVSDQGAGFSAPAIRGLILSGKGQEPIKGDKRHVAYKIIDYVLDLMKK